MDGGQTDRETPACFLTLSICGFPSLYSERICQSRTPYRQGRTKGKVKAELGVLSGWVMPDSLGRKKRRIQAQRERWLKQKGKAPVARTRWSHGMGS